MTHRSALLAAVAALGLGGAALAEGTPSPDGASAYILIQAPQDGAALSSPVTVVFGLKGMGVAPAGTEKERTGHHHLLIDRPPFGEAADDDLAAGIPADEHHKHFGGGQTETEIELPPGEHTLQLVLGDMNHVPHDPPVVSEVITITVE